MTNNTDPVRALIGQWRDAAEFFRGDAGSDIRETLRACARELESALAQQPAAPSGEAVAWLRMTPDGTPDWAEDCIGSDDKFLDPEMASDGYYLQPLYASPQQPTAVDEAAAIRAFEEHFEASSDDPYFEGELELWLTAWRKALAQQQGGA